MLSRDQGLWSDLPSKKYLKKNSLINDKIVSTTNIVSSTWQGILARAEMLKSGLKWSLGNGKSICFWTDIWVGEMRLFHSATFEARISDIEAKVCDYLLDNDWNIEKLKDNLPDPIVGKILALPLVKFSTGKDTQVWGHSSNGIFIAKPTYTLKHNLDQSQEWSWAFIWKIYIPPKLKTFL